MTYLDWAATAVPSISVSDYSYEWFNPNSKYAVHEAKKFSECEEKVKNAIGAKSGKVVFGGNASWFFSKIYANQADFWLCSPYEHDCIYKNGLQTDYNKLKSISNEIYCHQFVQNITGEIFPVDKIGESIRDKNGFFVCDATSGIGKAKIPDNIDNWCDAFVGSSHKLAVDNKQIGFAWISDKFAKWLLLEGSVVNGYGLVDGTPDLACARATTTAVVKSCKNVGSYDESYAYLNVHLIHALESNNIRFRVIPVSKENGSCCAIISIILNDINSDALCNYLASKEIYVSPGHSACEENSDYRVLKQYGLNNEECSSTIRVSFGPETTIDDINKLVDGIVRFKEEYCND